MDDLEIFKKHIIKELDAVSRAFIALLDKCEKLNTTDEAVDAVVESIDYANKLTIQDRRAKK